MSLDKCPKCNRDKDSRSAICWKCKHGNARTRPKKEPQAGDKRLCPGCKMRYIVGPPLPRDFSSIAISSRTVALLLAAALEFDETAQRETPGMCFSAVDFLDWLRPDLRESAA